MAVEEPESRQRDRKSDLSCRSGEEQNASLCWWLATRFGLREGHRGAISAIIVLKSHGGATIQASRDRALGTLIGAVLGFSRALLGTLPWGYILAVFLAVAVCGPVGFDNSSRLVGVTVTLLIFPRHAGHGSPEHPGASARLEAHSTEHSE